MDDKNTHPKLRMSRNLICDFSLKRYRKDKMEMEKHLKKAEGLLKSSTIVKRAKFIKNKDKAEYELNEGIIMRSKIPDDVKIILSKLDLSY